MSSFSRVGENPNNKMPPGKPLGPDEVAGTEDENVSGDDSFGILDEDEDDAANASETDRENQAGSARMDAGKFGDAD